MDPSQVTEKQTTIINPIFARHETFHPRYGWLKKGFDRTLEDKYIFSQEDAPVILGVGKNMVKAIKYWCIAFKILQEKKDADNKVFHEPSQFGLNLLRDEGWDPYLEDPLSLWLLHWSLFKSPCFVPAWYFTFNELNQLAFNTEDLLFSLREFKGRVFPTSRIKDSSENHKHH